MLACNRVPGALLFVGEDGVGKKLFALELAKALNCRTRVDEVEACDVCPSCKRISQSRFPWHKSDEDNKERMLWSEHTDIGLVRPYKRIIRVDPMRQLDREANFRPYEGRARVFIVEDAEAMNDNSSNALLKTLEEPPSTSHLVLLTSRPASLLPTIRSRCQTIRFVPLSTKEIEEHLLARDVPMSKGDAHLAASMARGSIGRALSTDIETYIEQRQAMLEVLDALAANKDRARLLRAAEELCDAKRKDEYEPRLSVLETLLHDVWTTLLGARDAPLANDDLREDLARIGTRLEGRYVALWISLIEKHRRKLDVNINRKVATDALFLDMAGSELRL
jgi:DNA polymerase-3 subunit delta'